jgi:hypothetical protein
MAVEIPSAPAPSVLPLSRPVPREASIDCQLERKLAVPSTEDEEELAAVAWAHSAL